MVLAMAKAQYEQIAASRLNLHYQVKQAYFQLYDLEKRQQILAEKYRYIQDTRIHLHYPGGSR